MQRTSILIGVVLACMACAPQSNPTDELPRTAKPADDGIGGDVPAAVMDHVRAQLALDSPRAATAQLMRSRPMIFNDGSLGCPEPGMSYTMATVGGYQIVFDVAGERFDYRISPQGAAKRCIDESANTD